MRLTPIIGFCLSIILYGSAIAQTGNQHDLLKKADSLISFSPDQSEALLENLIASKSNTLDCQLLGRAHRLLALIYSSQTRKADQIDHLLKSYQAFDDCSDQKELAEAKRLIGCYYMKYELLDKALEYLNQALTLARIHQDTITTVNVLSNMGQCYFTYKQWNRSLQLHQEAIALSEKVKFNKGLQENWNRISYTYWEANQLDKMLSSAKKALQYKTPNRDTLGILYGDLGLAYLQVGMHDSSDFYLQKGLDLIQQGKNRIQEIMLTGFLSDLRQEQGRSVEAISLLQRYNSLQKQNFIDQLQNEASFAQSRYDHLIHEKELAETVASNKRLIIGLGAIVIILLFMTVALMLIKRKRDALDQLRKVHEESEALLSQLFNKSPSFILTHSLNGEIISANETLQNQFQLDLNRIREKSIGDLIPQSYRIQFVNFVNDLKNKGSCDGWLTLPNKAGTSHVIRYQSKVIQVASGQPYCITFGMDDTETYKARVEADLERKRLLSVMESSPETYCILKRDGTIVFVNHPDFFAYKNPIGKSIFDLLLPEHNRRLIDKLNLVFDTGTPQEFEESYNNRIYSCKLIPIPSGDNQVSEVLGLGTDITETKMHAERERELRNKIEMSEKQYRSLVEDSHVLICSHDLDGYLTTVNKPGALSLGYQPEELIGKRLDAFISEEYKPEFYTYLSHIKKTGSFEGFLTISMKNGTRRIFLCKNTLLEGEQRILGSAQDVTEWKQAEYREKQAKKELQIAKEKAEESNRLKTVFLGSLSHEVRTPLQGILGFAEILDSHGLSEEKRKEYLNIIKRRAIDMQSIIDSLLDMAIAESGEIQSMSVETNLYEFAEITFLKFKQNYPIAKPIELYLDNKLNPTAIAYLDPQHLNQVLLNMFLNAVKFTNGGSITIAFSQEKNHFLIRVSDTGMGILPEKINYIFEPFRQAHEGISRSKGGIGLGLAIAKRLVELWEGEITVESLPEVGSTFNITIPFKSS
jgi:PAS domain S-box-containing protein